MSWPSSPWMAISSVSRMLSRGSFFGGDSPSRVDARFSPEPPLALPDALFDDARCPSEPGTATFADSLANCSCWSVSWIFWNCGVRVVGLPGATDVGVAGDGLYAVCGPGMTSHGSDIGCVGAICESGTWGVSWDAIIWASISGEGH